MVGHQRPLSMQLENSILFIAPHSTHAPRAEEAVSRRHFFSRMSWLSAAWTITRRSIAMGRTARRIDWDELGSVQIAETASSINRPLGSLEHLFWLLDQNRSIHFAVTAQIAGRASPYHWLEALERLQERHPILSVCIDGNHSIPRFRQDNPAPIPLRIVEVDPKARWESEVSEELAMPFDSSRAPLIRAVLIQGDRDTAFILVAHHAIADGLSLAYAIRDTLSAVSGGSLPALPSLPSQEEILAVRAGPVSLVRSTEQQDSVPGGNPGIYRPLDNARPRVMGLSLGPTLTARIRNRARREGTTVHGALSAAVAIAGRQRNADWQNTPIRVMSPINIRPLVGVGESCGVFVSATTTAIDGQATGFWRLARDTRVATAAGQTREAVMSLLSKLGEVVGKGAEVAVAAEFAAAAFAREILLTNLGALTFDDRFGRLKIEELWGPSVLGGMEGEQTIGVAAVNGSISLTHTSHTPTEGLLTAMRSVLVKACQ